MRQLTKVSKTKPKLDTALNKMIQMRKMPKLSMKEASTPARKGEREKIEPTKQDKSLKRKAP